MKELYYQSAEHYVRCLAKAAKTRAYGRVIPTRIAEEIYNYDKLVQPDQSLCLEVYNRIRALSELDDKKENTDAIINILKDAEKELGYYKKVGIYDDLSPEVERVHSKEYNEFVPAQSFGIYFLYDVNETIIYIGKSEANLKHRSISSIMQKKARMVKYLYPKSKADTRVYELYYINQHKPMYNRDAKTEDELTISLPELEGSETIRIYSIDCMN